MLSIYFVKILMPTSVFCDWAEMFGGDSSYEKFQRF